MLYCNLLYNLVDSQLVHSSYFQHIPNKVPITHLIVPKELWLVGIWTILSSFAPEELDHFLQNYFIYQIHYLVKDRLFVNGGIITLFGRAYRKFGYFGSICRLLVLKGTILLLVLLLEPVDKWVNLIIIKIEVQKNCSCLWTSVGFLEIVLEI